MSFEHLNTEQTQDPKIIALNQHIVDEARKKWKATLSPEHLELVKKAEDFGDLAKSQDIPFVLFFRVKEEQDFIQFNNMSTASNPLSDIVKAEFHQKLSETCSEIFLRVCGFFEQIWGNQYRIVVVPKSLVGPLTSKDDTVSISE